MRRDQPQGRQRRRGGRALERCGNWRRGARCGAPSNAVGTGGVERGARRALRAPQSRRRITGSSRRRSLPTSTRFYASWSAWPRPQFRRRLLATKPERPAMMSPSRTNVEPSRILRIPSSSSRRPVTRPRPIRPAASSAGVIDSCTLRQRAVIKGLPGQKVTPLLPCGTAIARRKIALQPQRYFETEVGGLKNCGEFQTRELPTATTRRCVEPFRTRRDVSNREVAGNEPGPLCERLRTTCRVEGATISRSRCRVFADRRRRSRPLRRRQ
jgi:hypothetical protein